MQDSGMHASVAVSLGEIHVVLTANRWARQRTRSQQGCGAAVNTVEQGIVVTYLVTPRKRHACLTYLKTSITYSYVGGVSASNSCESKHATLLVGRLQQRLR